MRTYVIKQFINMTLFISIIRNTCYAQITYTNKQIENLLANKCAVCHEDNTIRLSSNNDFLKNRSMVSYVLKNKIMPPWKADSSCKNIINNRSLSVQEIEAITSWLNHKIQDNKDKVKYKSTDKEDEYNFDKYDKPDLIFKPQRPYKINAGSGDDFETFLIDLNLKEDIYIKAIRIIPGNKKLVHHARVEFDSSDFYKKSFSLNVFQRITNDIFTSDSFHASIPGIGFYVPGLNIVKFPDNSNVKITKNMKLILNIHYAPSPIDDFDHTMVYIYLDHKATPLSRKVYCTSKIFSEKKVVIKANTFTTINFVSDTINQDLSLFGIQPHMHLLGNSIKVFLISNINDTTKLIDIPKWDFNWQEFYFFKSFINIPKGSVLYTIATFNNTSSNPLNPYSPPMDINFGDMKTTNEMLGSIILALPYKKGDENIKLESLYK